MIARSYSIVTACAGTTANAYSCFVGALSSNANAAFGRLRPNPRALSSSSSSSSSLSSLSFSSSSAVASAKSSPASSSSSSSSMAASFDYDVPLPDSIYTQAMMTTSDGFIPAAFQLREYYDSVFGDPREPDGRRFAFDPWYVTAGEGKFGKDAPNLPGNNDGKDASSSSSFWPTKAMDGEREATASQVQYSLTRVQCSDFFPEEMFDNLAEEMTALGRTIGLAGTTNPWMSLYVDGDLQNFHTDAPHGQMAWVLGLTRYDSSFSGGETMLLRPSILDYWRGFDASRGLEAPAIVRYLPSYQLGRCVVFDGRVPHGVNRVVGTKDVRLCRAVLHGWFAEPEVCWFGPWDDNHDAHYGGGGDDDGGVATAPVQREEEEEEAEGGKEATSLKRAEAVLKGTLEPLVEALGEGEIGRVTGYLAVRVDVAANGVVTGVRSVCDTLQADPEDFRGVIGFDEFDRPVMEDACADVRLSAYEALKGMVFPAAGTNGRSIVVPFAFS